MYITPESIYRLCYLNDGGQGELWEADGGGLSVEVLQYEVIQLVYQPVLQWSREVKIIYSDV